MYYAEQKKIITLIVLLPLLIIILTYTTSLINNNNNSATLNISIDNLNEALPNISNEDKHLLFYQLFDKISLNTPISSKITDDDFEVENSTIQKNETSSYTNTTFIIRNKTSQQEYKIQYNNGEIYDNYMFDIECYSLCLETKSSSISDDLPYSNTTSSMHWILDKGNYFSPNNIDLSVLIDTCDNNPDISNIESEINSYVSKYGIFDYKLSKQYSCFIQD